MYPKIILNIFILLTISLIFVSCKHPTDLPDVDVNDFKQYWFENKLDHYNY